MSRKAQTTMILLVLIIIIFAGMAVFLLSLAGTVSQDKYLDLYATNFLISILRTDTGYTDSNCKLVSDLLACAFFTSEYHCGGTGPTCRELANSTIYQYTQEFEMIKKSFDYLFTVKPKGFISQTRITFGNPDLEDYRGWKRIAHEEIQRGSQATQYTLEAELIITRK